MNSTAEFYDCPSSDTTHQSWTHSPSFAAESHTASLELPWERTKLKVPRQDRSIFCRPELRFAPQLAMNNQALLQTEGNTISGRPLAEWRQTTRLEILELAQAYTSSLLGQPVGSLPDESALLFCSGHQPALFHPGVWIKNFAIHQLARRTSGIALNLVVDNDTISHRQLRVPEGSRQHPRSRLVPFDDPVPSGPWEEARIENFERFHEFGPTIIEAMQPWGITPLLEIMWPDMVSQAEASPLLRDVFTAARRKQEERWGLSNWELPLSQVCESRSFCWFASAILTRLPRFWETYNTVLAEFRQINRIRSQTHPVPALIETDGWFEAPFWVWRAGEQRRQRVMAKACSQEVRLSDGQDIFARLPLSTDGDLTAATEVLRNLPQEGIRFRSRALTTTLFARLGLSDLFIHGIGGAKYDEMTDQLISRFFGLPVPGFLTMSCTLHLPLGQPFPVTIQQEQRLRHQLRDMQFNPERHLPADVEDRFQHLIAEKNALIVEKTTAPTAQLPLAERHRLSRENYERHVRLKEITQQLTGETAAARKSMESQLETIREQLQANTILEDREFSFSLYPEDKLRELLTQDLPAKLL